MMNIVLFGPPGAGKGTQASRLESKYGVVHISTGEIIREEISHGTPLGKEAAAYINKGHLAPDDLVINIIADYIEHHRDSRGILFDGFPRTIAQAEALDRMLGSIGADIKLMASLEVPDEELVSRIQHRAKDSGRADDFDMDVIENRISVYKRQTAVVADYYAAQGKYFPVDGTCSIDEVFDSLCRTVESVA